MNRVLKRLILTVLSMLPLPRVALAAESKLLDIAGEEQSDRLHAKIQNARKNIFRKGQMETSLEEAREIIDFHSSDLDEKAKQKILEESLQILKENNLIEQDEDRIRSAIPSDGYVND